LNAAAAVAAAAVAAQVSALYEGPETLQAVQLLQLLHLQRQLNKYINWNQKVDLPAAAQRPLPISKLH
jgi:hypothetical protein